jgi:predicted Fe-Mo cluster-binding NifX family protein
MILAISSSGKGIDSNIYSKFERCNFFLIVDLDNNTALPITNISRERPHEIGSKVGKFIAKLGIDVIITTDIGPRAFEIFKQNEMKIYRAEGIIEEAIKQLKKEKLPEITKATLPRYLDWKKNKKLNS